MNKEQIINMAQEAVANGAGGSVSFTLTAEQIIKMFGDVDAKFIPCEDGNGFMRNGLWYPDDGPWVEFDGNNGPDGNIYVETLSDSEREDREYWKTVDRFDEVSHVVAYKIVG